MYKLVYMKVVLYMKHVWCLMMNTCRCEHVFNHFLSMCLMIMLGKHVFVNVCMYV
jgi:cell division protein FtsW (lipid II flippase)